jgi:hypothetical protein
MFYFWSFLRLLIGNDNKQVQFCFLWLAGCWPEGESWSEGEPARATPGISASVP